MYSRLAGYEDTNDAERLAEDPTFRMLASRARRDTSIALTSTLHWFETNVLTEERNYQGLARLNTALSQQAATRSPNRRVTLDIDRSESPVYGAQEQSAYNGHFETVCYHPLFVFNSEGDCLAAKLRPGNVHSADGWDDVLLPIIDRYRAQGQTVVVRADAAFALPALYEALERRGVRYAIHLPANDVLERRIEDLLTRPRGRPSHAPLVRYRSFEYQPASWGRPRRVIAKIEHHLGELSARVGFIVTTLTGTNRAIVRFYNQRGTAEQWIKEGKTATHWTRLSCHRFRANEVRLLLSVIAYNLGNLLRRLALPAAIQDWSLTSLQQRLLKTGGRLIRHARYFTLQPAESYLTGSLFRQILQRIERLTWHPTSGHRHPAAAPRRLGRLQGDAPADRARALRVSSAVRPTPRSGHQAPGAPRAVADPGGASRAGDGSALAPAQLRQPAHRAGRGRALHRRSGWPLQHPAHARRLQPRLPSGAHRCDAPVERIRRGRTRTDAVQGEPMNAKLRARIQTAVVQFPDRGRGVVVPGQMIVTVAHVCDGWPLEDHGMAHGDPCLQPVRVGGHKVFADILALEPCADIAVLGAPSAPELAEAYGEALEPLTPVSISVTDLPLQEWVPVHIYTHQDRWVTARAQLPRFNASALRLEANERILSGTSGSPVVTERGHLLGPVSISGGNVGEPHIEVVMPRLHLTAPGYLVRLMRDTDGRSSAFWRTRPRTRTPRSGLDWTRSSPLRSRPRRRLPEQPQAVVISLS